MFLGSLIVAYNYFQPRRNRTCKNEYFLWYFSILFVMDTNRKRATFSLSPDAIKLLKKLADEEKRSQSNMIEFLIYERVKKK